MEPRYSWILYCEFASFQNIFESPASLLTALLRSSEASRRAEKHLSRLMHPPVLTWCQTRQHAAFLFLPPYCDQVSFLQRLLSATSKKILCIWVLRKKAVTRFMEKHVLAELHPSTSSSAVGQELDANKPAVCVKQGVSKQKHIGSTFM